MKSFSVEVKNNKGFYQVFVNGKLKFEDGCQAVTLSWVIDFLKKKKKH